MSGLCAVALRTAGNAARMCHSTLTVSHSSLNLSHVHTSITPAAADMADHPLPAEFVQKKDLEEFSNQLESRIAKTVGELFDKERKKQKVGLVIQNFLPIG